MNEHVSKLYAKAGKLEQVLSRLSRVLIESNKKCCCTIVLWDTISTIVVSYGMFAQILMDIILKNFKRALRFVTSDFKSSYFKLFDKCNKQPLYIV